MLLSVVKLLYTKAISTCFHWRLNKFLNTACQINNCTQHGLQQQNKHFNNKDKLLQYKRDRNENIKVTFDMIDERHYWCHNTNYLSLELDLYVSILI